MRSHPSTGRGPVLPATLTLILLALSPGALHARPLDGGELDRIRSGNDAPDLRGAMVGGGFSSAQTDTIWFGGTRWDAVDGRWEAIQDSCWTFDSGVGSDYDFSDPDVDPFKDTSLHAHMEGWIGFDKSYGGANPYFRRLDGSADWEGGIPCVGSTAGLGGAASLWAGVLAGEAEGLCYASGQGYGNGWNLSVERTFPVTPGAPITLSFSYSMELESGYDFVHAEADTGDGFVELWSATGTATSTATIDLIPGIDAPMEGSFLTLRFRVASDNLYSDEDGEYATQCGAFAVDDIALSGGTTYTTDFESDDGGWTLSDPPAGAGGDWSNIVALSSLPPMITSCSCSLEDSVLVFEDLNTGGHGLFQDNLAASPWIDLAASGLVGMPGKVIRAEAYVDLPLLNYMFAQFNVQWSPATCAATGLAISASPWTSNGFVYYFGGVPNCRGTANPILLDFGGVIDLQAEEVRIAVGILSYCRFFGNCTGIANSTPWYDNVKFGVFGTAGAPYLTTEPLDRPQDAWSQNRTQYPNSPGRIDQARIKGAPGPEPGTSRGDTLVVRGGSGGSEVYVQFAVHPGAETDTTAIQAWLTSHTYEGNWLGLDWYSARMDTAIQGTAVVPGVWATLYHENDPNFSGNQFATDPMDLDSKGQQTRRLNDIFPDNLFTPGSRVMLFYKAIHDGSEVPYTGLWYTHPDTSGGNYLEMEILPSSATPFDGFGSSSNCILYVHHGGNPADRERMEAALATVVSGGSVNFENTPWDRYDVNDPSSGDVALGSPPGTQYGVSLDQLLGYSAIVWDTGRSLEFNLTNEDAAVLTPWLTLEGRASVGYKNLYLSGDDLVSSVVGAAATDPDALTLLESHLGVSWTCDTVRDASCPGSPALQDTVACIQVDPTGNPFAGSAGPDQVVLRGNGCPELRSFDVIAPATGASGSPAGNEVYDSTVKGPIPFHSVANLIPGPYSRSVVDGASVTARRSALDCTDPSRVADRLSHVLGWFGYAGTGQSCPSARTCFGLGAADLPYPEAHLSVLPGILLGMVEPPPPSPYWAGNYFQVLGCSGPVGYAHLEIRFTPEADALITWGPGQDHPVISATTDGAGIAWIPIIAGGCVPSGLHIPGPAAEIFADGVKLGELSFTSLDMVDASGKVPGEPGWTRDCGVTVGISDATFFGSGSPSLCYDFNGDDTPADEGDQWLLQQQMGLTTCTVTAASEPALVDALRPAAPNPFRGATRFALSLTEPSPVRLVVYDVTGRVVRTLADGTLPAGVNDLGWDGRDEAGSLVGAGLYFYRLVSPRVRETGKLVLLR